MQPPRGENVTATDGNTGDAKEGNDASASQRSDMLEREFSHKKSWADPLQRRHTDLLQRRRHDDKVVGLAEGARRTLRPPGSYTASLEARHEEFNGDIPLEDDESYARGKVERRPILLAAIGYYTAAKIFVFYLVSLNSLITVMLSVIMTIYWHEMFQNDEEDKLTGAMDWTLLGFAVVTPLSASIGMAFRRRDRALVEIAKFRSSSFQLFLAHCMWDWDGGRAESGIDWVGHADDVLKELVSIGDEMCRFLTLPTASFSRHRMTKSGRREAARTAEVAYRLYDSLYSRRLVKLAQLSEKIKRAGLGVGEAMGIRQYENKMGDAIENLRLFKFYRTPETLRSFARLFTTFLPPFFAPTFAELAIDIDSLPIAITLAVVVSLCLNALFAGVIILEDPFVGFVTLDGIDVREEFQVLHYQQLVSARNNIFQEVRPYESQATLVSIEELSEGKESSGTAQKENPPTNASEGTHQRRHHRLPSLGGALGNASKGHQRRHTRLPSLGDAHFLVGRENDVDKRQSGFQLCAGKKDPVAEEFVSAWNNTFRGAKMYGSQAGSQATLVSMEELSEGKESSEMGPNENPPANASEGTHQRRHHRFPSLGDALGNASKGHQRRHTRLPSLGDAHFLVGHENDVDKRQSGFQLCASKKDPVVTSPTDA